MADPGAGRRQRGRARAAAAGLVPFAFVVAMAAYVAGPGSEAIGLGVPLPDVSIERIDFVDGEIRAVVRNTGPVPVSVAVADVNDRIQPAAVEPDGRLERFESALVRIPFPWNEAEPYTVGITTDDGTRFERRVDAAAPSLEPDAGTAGLLATLGVYVGVIPVMVGLLWLPFMRGMRSRRLVFFLSLTAGLLLFLGADAAEEALSLASGVTGEENGLDAGFGGAMLVVVSASLSFLALHWAGGMLARRAGGSGNGRASPMAAALMISAGIGLHNLGEGLAIGAAVGLGEAALGAFLVLGFALHNTTEGIAIAAPLAGSGGPRRTPVLALAALGLLAGAPAILGAWMGGFLYSPLSAAVFLSIGVGAIFQVAWVVLRWVRDMERGPGGPGAGFPGAAAAAGLAAGMSIMYATSIIV